MVCMKPYLRCERIFIIHKRGNIAQVADDCHQQSVRRTCLRHYVVIFNEDFANQKVIIPYINFNIFQ